MWACGEDNFFWTGEQEEQEVRQDYGTKLNKITTVPPVLLSK